MARDYWLDLFTGTTWEEFLAAGGQATGFRERRRKLVERIRVGDHLLCYLTGVSRFIGLLEVQSAAYLDSKQIWREEVFPCRLRVSVLIALTPETAVPVMELRGQLTAFRNLTYHTAWTGAFRTSPSKWEPADGKAVVAALLGAQRNPVSRPVDPRKFARRPRT